MHKLFLPFLFAAFGVSAGFSQTYTSGEWSYTLNSSNEATITAYGGASGAVTIPATIDGYAVKVVGNGQNTIFEFNNSAVTSVSIPNSVTGIGRAAFYGCTSLTGVTIPSSVTSIGDAAFYRCEALTNIDVASDNSTYSSINGR